MNKTDKNLDLMELEILATFLIYFFLFFSKVKILNVPVYHLRRLCVNVKN